MSADYCTANADIRISRSPYRQKSLIKLSPNAKQIHSPEKISPKPQIKRKIDALRRRKAKNRNQKYSLSLKKANHHKKSLSEPANRISLRLFFCFIRSTPSFPQP